MSGTMRIVPVCLLVLGILCLGSISAVRAVERDEIALPAPDREGGKPLMQALALRKSTRGLKDAPLSEQELGNLLWATWGVNRENGRHTVPTANNKQEALVFVATESGVWRYEPKGHSLVKVLPKDMRAAYKAPVVLLFAAPSDNRFSGMHVGSMYQNAGLYCASAGLGNVVKSSGRDELKGDLPLPDGYEVLIIQLVGWPS